MNEATTLLLDLDGTLADTLEDIRASTNHVRGTYGLEPLPAEIVRSFVGNGVVSLLRAALVEAGHFESLEEQAWCRYREHHRNQCVVHVQPYPGVRDHLRRWRDDSPFSCANRIDATAGRPEDGLDPFFPGPAVTGAPPKK